MNFIFVNSSAIGSSVKVWDMKGLNKRTNMTKRHWFVEKIKVVKI
jgi:hypothetical protein